MRFKQRASDLARREADLAERLLRAERLATCIPTTMVQKPARLHRTIEPVKHCCHRNLHRYGEGLTTTGQLFHPHKSKGDQVDDQDSIKPLISIQRPEEGGRGDRGPKGRGGQLKWQRGSSDQDRMYIAQQTEREQQRSTSAAAVRSDPGGNRGIGWVPPTCVLP